MIAAAGNLAHPSPFAATSSENNDAALNAAADERAQRPLPSPSSSDFEFPSASSLERAATAPAASLAWQRREGALLLSPSSSGFFAQLTLSIGPLHRAPSRSGSTVQTGETLDAASAAALAAITAEAMERKNASGSDEFAAVAAAVAAEFGEGCDVEADAATTAVGRQQQPQHQQQPQPNQNNPASPPAGVTLMLSEVSRLAAVARTAALNS